ncbi:unnamed protein product [Kuraishia capsulata CBS 1993]|uniref:Uncharacterized protein n=1 Tax=Kuraishia capsulata CBS 1993 TaxID=1382522 RepID=W6MXG5_9ASCO|nr:uncharacterized protein KUCA_T00004835001 [Kuraishia capsulata CBS 1993]CDK28850.1 unnamed protein product [Kuraishia capsulata CBS 1993]
MKDSLNILVDSPISETKLRHYDGSFENSDLLVRTGTRRDYDVEQVQDSDDELEVLTMESVLRMSSSRTSTQCTESEDTAQQQQAVDGVQNDIHRDDGSPKDNKTMNNGDQMLVRIPLKKSSINAVPLNQRKAAPLSDGASITKPHHLVRPTYKVAYRVGLSRRVNVESLHSYLKKKG